MSFNEFYDKLNNNIDAMIEDRIEKLDFSRKAEYQMKDIVADEHMLQEDMKPIQITSAKWDVKNGQAGIILYDNQQNSYWLEGNVGTRMLLLEMNKLLKDIVSKIVSGQTIGANGGGNVISSIVLIEELSKITENIAKLEAK